MKLNPKPSDIYDSLRLPAFHDALSAIQGHAHKLDNGVEQYFLLMETGSHLIVSGIVMLFEDYAPKAGHVDAEKILSGAFKDAYDELKMKMKIVE